MTIPRVYPILDTALLARRGMGAPAAAGALLEGGARILQIRHKEHWSRGLFEQARRIAAMCREAGAVCIVDDRADIALLVGAGLHVGQDDLPPGEARRLMGPQAVLGFSSHNPAQLCAAAEEPVDYVALGPIFATTSKQNPDPVLGIEEVRRCSGGRIPLVAIGGITRATARAVLEAGADSVAVIADLYPDPCTEQSLRERMEEWQQAVAT